MVTQVSERSSNVLSANVVILVCRHSLSGEETTSNLFLFFYLFCFTFGCFMGAIFLRLFLCAKFVIGLVILLPIFNNICTFFCVCQFCNPTGTSSLVERPLQHLLSYLFSPLHPYQDTFCILILEIKIILHLQVCDQQRAFG